MSAPAPDVTTLFASAADARIVLLAVSGGPDSLALLHLAAIWRKAGGPPLHAVTVDHGMRPEARAEAEWVAAWAGALGVAHSIVSWTGVKPTSRLQERAREARYGLIEALANDLGADVLMTGHHADDQAETILFRLLRGSGIGGLAGMAPVSRRGNLRLVRPLLSMPKSALVSICEAAGQPFFRDPSNENPRFARTGLRRLIAILAEQGLGTEDLLRLGRRAARAETAIRTGVEASRAGLAPAITEGRFDVPAARLRELPEEIVLRILEGEIARIGGSAPRLDQLETLTAKLAGTAPVEGPWRMSLGGALAGVSPKGRFSIIKAPPRRSPKPSSGN